MKNILKAVGLAFVLSAATSAGAATIVFEEDFSGYGSNTVLNAGNGVFGGNWKTTNGTVDFIAAGSAFGSLCSNGGNCVDLDGSTGDAGVFETARTFGAGLYNVLFQIAGNNRFGSDVVTISFGGVVRSITLAFNQVASQADFGDDFLGITVTGGTTLSFSNAGGDNIGILLKTIVIENSPATVPVPAAGGLLLVAMGAMAALRRRKPASV
jgi:hypothetical protein